MGFQSSISIGAENDPSRKHVMKFRVPPEIIASLPNSPGVYLFYGPQEELLYVGKSKAVRTRVRSHFSAAEERWLCRKVHRVEVRRTAGELGALLLESQLIKELRPFHNVAQRSRRRIIVARRVLSKQGYIVVNLDAVDYLEVRESEPILGVFKHRTQAKEFLDMIAKSHRLCPKLLKLEVTRGYCFSYHLHQCDGACMGEEDAARYNARVEDAFEARRIKAWPYESAVAIEERVSDGSHREVFLLDNWCLIGGVRSSDGAFEKMVQTPRRFDYDSYKILYSYMTDPQNQNAIKPLTRQQFADFQRDGLRSLAANTIAPSIPTRKRSKSNGD
jgi:DNA polymerase-3 subunit epsilon